MRSFEIILDHVVNVSLLFLCFQHLVGDAQRLAWHLPGLAIILRRLVPTNSHPHGDHSVSWYHQYDQYGQYDQYNKYLQDPSSVNHMTSNSPGRILRIAPVWTHNRMFVSVVCRSTPCITCASSMFASRFPSVVTQQYTHCYAHLHHQPQNGCKTN